MPRSAKALEEDFTRALAADALERLAALKVAQAELKAAWVGFNVSADLSGWGDMQEAVRKVLEV